MSVLTPVTSISFFFFFLMIRRPPRSTLFPTRRSSDLYNPGYQSAVKDLKESTKQRFIAIDFGYPPPATDRKSTRLNSSHTVISYAVFCLKKKKKKKQRLH